MCWIVKMIKEILKSSKEQDVISDIGKPVEEIVVNDPVYMNVYIPKKSKRQIKDIVVHCTATREGVYLSVDEIREWHIKKGWSDIGYHYVIYLDGSIHEGRPVDRVGAHVKGFNRKSIGITYVGGVDVNLNPKDTRTQEQKESLERLLINLKRLYPSAKTKGHRDFSKDLNNNGVIEPFEWMKVCPSFDAKKEYKHL